MYTYDWNIVILILTLTLSAILVLFLSCIFSQRKLPFTTAPTLANSLITLLSHGQTQKNHELREPRLVRDEHR